MRPTLRHLAVFALTTATCTGALAFKQIGSRWLEPTTTFHVGFTETSISGVPWSDAFVEAMNQWTDNTDFTFVVDPTYVDPCNALDGINSTRFSGSLCGRSFGGSVLAVTLTQDVAGALGFSLTTETDIIFNTAFSWDVYDGPRQSRVDFRRVALHELGHALGLDHETTEPAIMAPSIGNLHTLQADDIAGANATYGGSGLCLVRDVATSAAIANSLGAGDCRVEDLLGGSNDSSFVDVYRLRVEQATMLDIVMQSSELDAVLVLSNASLTDMEIFDDIDGGCDARIRQVLQPGEYRLLANTYEAPEKCAGNTGAYSLTISDSGMPLLGTIRNAAGGTALANAGITGGATVNAGASFATAFTADQAIDVLARVVPDPTHVGSAGHVYVLARLGDGRQFMKNGSGQFVPFTGGLANLVPFKTGTLAASESITVASGLRGSVSGLAGLTISVYVGYALDSAPQEIWYGSTPIQFTITLP